MADAVAKPITVRDVLSVLKGNDEIEIVNEIEEPLIQISQRYKCVAPLTNVLSNELLDRTVLGTFYDLGVDVIVVAGEDDAE